ncbi:MAG TPA: cyclic nucleotide-binding domain-containing protein [Kofleriaceae bacterium]|nr:cyclic nucleotide-binding domain-containing protein [Kofleriaceae bacterium]
MSGDASDQAPEADEASVLATQLLKGKPGPDTTDAGTSKMPSVASSAIEAVEVHDTSPGTNEPSAMARLRVQGGTELARGGMGSIHRVQDPGIGRWVALKRVDADQARKVPEVAHLLLEEAQITGQLEHPNIVPIYDLGNDEHGNPMFTMKLVAGQTLTALIGLSERRGHGPHQLRAILDALVKACDAVAYAHDKGVIHRDLKPDNIMVGSYGQVYVVDWGCALVKSDPPGRAPREEHVRVHSAGTARTSPEAVLGTVAYMAPEQARGHLGLIDERSDVYSLGAILYQVLTRRPPHRGKDAAHSMQMAQAGEVLPPTELRPHFDIPAQLAGIAMKALAALPQDRYQTVLELRDALKDFLAGGSWLPSRRFLKDDIIVAEGEAGDAAYIIVSGTCEASRSIQGATTVIRRMGPGDVFGETAILTDQPRSATVTAVTDMIVTVITREAVEGELMGASWVGAFARALAARFREAERRADAAHDLAGRVLDAIRVHLLAGKLLEAPWVPLRTAIAAAFGVAEHLVDDAVVGATEIVIDETSGVIRLVAT